jgi:hypothetical protein
MNKLLICFVIRRVPVVPPRFWDALCGAFPEDRLDPETRKVFNELFEDGQDMPDAIEDRLLNLE